jgi:hypothetical protein
MLASTGGDHHRQPIEQMGDGQRRLDPWPRRVLYAVTIQGFLASTKFLELRPPLTQVI